MEVILVDDICGTNDIAKRLGTSRTVVHRWIERRSGTKFPLHKATCNKSMVYDWTEVSLWHDLWTSTRRRKEM